MATLQEFRTADKSWWCPGCGDFGVLAALQKSLVDLGREPEQVAVVSGIGCSGKIGNYVNGYNLHVTHGRSLPAATGMKLANRELTVIAAGGDGDGFAIGMGHFVHAVRRNTDITYLVMDNHIYGLTKGQCSPTSDAGFKTKSTPDGNIERSVKPLSLAIAAGATFVAQGFSSNQKQLVELIKAGIQHKGFALINAISPCVTFNKVNTYDFYKEILTDLNTVEGYNPADKNMALRALLEHNELVTGLIYQDKETRSFDDRLPNFKEQGIVNQDWTLDQALFAKVLAQFK